MRLPGSGAINHYLTLPGPLRIGSPASNIGTLFLYGIVAGAVAMAGLSMLPTAGRRASHRALAMRQGTQLAWTERGNGNLRPVTGRMDAFQDPGSANPGAGAFRS
jgi:hypothetical protein